MVAQNSRFVQPVKIEVMDIKVFGRVNPAERKGRAGDAGFTAGAGGQAAHESRLAAAQVGAQLDYLAAFKVFS